MDGFEIICGGDQRAEVDLADTVNPEAFLWCILHIPQGSGAMAP